MTTKTETRATKQLLLTEIIERYPRMVRLLKAAEKELYHNFDGPIDHDELNCVRCQIQALLKEVKP